MSFGYTQVIVGMNLNKFLVTFLKIGDGSFTRSFNIYSSCNPQLLVFGSFTATVSQRCHVTRPKARTISPLARINP